MEEIVLAIVSEEEEEAVPGEILSNTVELIRRSSTLNADWVLLDSQSTISLFCNPRMFSNIRKCKKGEEKRCYCNGGAQDTNQIGDLAGFGTVYYNFQSISNILLLASVVKQRQVIFDSVDGNVFKVFGRKQRVIKFKQSPKGLYYWNTAKHRTEELVLVNIAKENERRYTKREVNEANKAQRLNKLIGYPSRVDMEAMLNNNLIKNCPVTPSDNRRVVDIYGVNLESVRGKTARVRPVHVRTDIINPLPD